jgi:integrase
MNREELESFFAEKAYSPHTEDSYSRAIHDAWDYLGDLSELSPPKFREWLDSHEAWGNSMRWLAYSAVRSFLKWRYGETHPALNLSIRRTESGPQRTLSIEEAKRIYKYLKNKTCDKGIRDLAIYSLLMDTGLRSSEICRLNRDNLDLDNRLLHVQVKGGEWGHALFSDVTTLRIIDWLQVRTDHVDGTKAVFVGIKGSRPGTRITPSGLRVIVRKWGKRSGVGPLSPHDFRRSFATISTILQAPPRMVQIAGRWSRLKEVERYTRGLQLLEFDDYLPMREISKTE